MIPDHGPCYYILQPIIRQDVKADICIFLEVPRSLGGSRTTISFRTKSRRAWRNELRAASRSQGKAAFLSTKLYIGWSGTFGRTQMAILRSMRSSHHLSPFTSAMPQASALCLGILFLSPLSAVGWKRSEWSLSLSDLALAKLDKAHRSIVEP